MYSLIIFFTTEITKIFIFDFVENTEFTKPDQYKAFELYFFIKAKNKI